MQKKLISGFVIVLVLILGTLYVLGNRSQMVYKTIEEPSDSIDPDSDDDGLQDWEEDLYGTNKAVSDTDNDGTSDGDEVAQGRDPLTPGPDDYLGGVDVVSPQLSEAEILEAQREFLNDYLLEAAGEIQEVTITSLIEGYDKEAFRARYAISDLNTIAIASSTEIRAYGNTLALTFEKYGNTNRIPEDEFEIFERALDSRNQSDLSKLILIAELYEALADEMRVMEVPFGVAEHHLMFVNGYDIFARALRAMANFFEDPVQGGGAYQAYLVQSAAIRAAFLHTADYFAGYDILFNEDEPGRLFLYDWQPG